MEIILNKICHPYYIVDESPWPLFRAMGDLIGIVYQSHN